MSYLAGSVVRSTVTFVPASSTVDIANVSATITDSEGTQTNGSPVAGATNVFYADVVVPDTAISGPWLVRWECSAPKISYEDSFAVTASSATTP